MNEPTKKTYVVGLFDNQNNLVYGPRDIEAESLEQAQEELWDEVEHEFYVDEVNPECNK